MGMVPENQNKLNTETQRRQKITRYQDAQDKNFLYLF